MQAGKTGSGGLIFETSRLGNQLSEGYGAAAHCHQWRDLLGSSRTLHSAAQKHYQEEVEEWRQLHFMATLQRKCCFLTQRTTSEVLHISDIPISLGHMSWLCLTQDGCTFQESCSRTEFLNMLNRSMQVFPAPIHSPFNYSLANMGRNMPIMSILQSPGSCALTDTCKRKRWFKANFKIIVIIYVKMLKYWKPKTE